MKSRQEKVNHPVNWIFGLSAAEKPEMGALLILQQLQCVPLDSASPSFLLGTCISTQKPCYSHHTAIIKMPIAIITTAHKVPRLRVTATTIICDLPTCFFFSIWKDNMFHFLYLSSPRFTIFPVAIFHGVLCPM